MMHTVSVWHWLVVLVIVGVIGAVVYAARRETANGAEPSSVGGWLVLPIFGFVAQIVLTAKNLFDALLEIEGLKAIFTEGGPSEALKLPTAASFVMAMVVIFSSVLCLYMIFTANRRLIWMATVHYVALVLTSFTELWASGEIHKALPDVATDPNAVKEAVRSLLIAAIWIPYFHRSRRVRNMLKARTLIDNNPGFQSDLSQKSGAQ